MRPLRVLGWSACAALLAVSFLRPREGRRPGTFAARLWGPIATLAAGGQWVRVRLALEDGRPEVAYSRAEVAFELDPGATSAWSFLASHLAYDRASEERGRNPARSADWVRAALDLLTRGEAQARQPEQLAMHRAVILIQAGRLAEGTPWPGGMRGAWTEAREAFERALELDPGLSGAWVGLATHVALGLGAAEVEPELAARLRALDEALAILERGAASARQPEDLSYHRGYILGLFADGPDGTARPGGRRTLYREAIEAFEAAERLGHRGAHHAEQSARLVLEGLE